MEEELLIKTLKNIESTAKNLDQLIILTNIRGAENILDYKLKDVARVTKFLRKCQRCGEYFLPVYVNRSTQVFCGKGCRNYSTREHKFELHLDEYQRPLDLLRKNIYERKYRANRDNLKYNSAEFEMILKKISILLKTRKQVTREIYFDKVNKLYDEFYSVVEKDKLLNK